jgi:hypothetical protein
MQLFFFGYKLPCFKLKEQDKSFRFKGSPLSLQIRIKSKKNGQKQ